MSESQDQSTVDAEELPITIEELPTTVDPKAKWSDSCLVRNVVLLQTRIGNPKWVLVLPMSLIVVLLSILLVIPQLSEGATPSLSILQPVEPGLGLSHCEPVDMKADALEFIDELLLATSKHHMHMATALHFGLKSCVLAMCAKDEPCNAMINPHIINTHTTAFVTQEDPQLCSNPKAVHKKRHTNIDVQWFDKNGTPAKGHFEKPVSYKLQHMLDVLYGVDVCG